MLPVTTARKPRVTCPGFLIRSAAMVVLLAAGLAASACSSSAKTPALPTPEARAAAAPMQADAWTKLGYRIDWRGFATMLPGSKVLFMDQLGDVVAVQESSGVLSVLEVKTGATRWSDQVASSLSRYIGNVRDGDRLVSSTDSEAFFYDLQTGTLKARQKLSIVSNRRPVKVGEILVYGAGSGQVLGHLTLNGFRQWGAMMDGPIESDPLALSNGRVALVSRGGDVVVLDGSSGLIDVKGKIYLGTEAALATGPEVLYIASLDHSLYAISERSGDILWRVRTDAPLREAPVLHEGVVYSDMGTDGITAFNATTGKKLWSNAAAKGEIIGVRNKRLLGFDGSNAYTLDAGKGTTVESVKLEGVSILKTDQFVDGNLYAASPGGVVTKLATR